MIERKHRSFSGERPLWSGGSIPAPLRQAWAPRRLVCPGCLLRFPDEGTYVTHWLTENARENKLEMAALAS